MNFDLTEEMKKQLDYMIAQRRCPHRHPCVSFRDEDIRDYLAAAIAALGPDALRPCGKNGLVADLHGHTGGKTIAFRADMDALPIQEETGLPFASENPGVMHACGHDCHTAALLGLLRSMTQHRAALKYNVRFIFQYAEEPDPGGAIDMIANGCLAGVDRIYGLHVDNQLSVGTIGIEAYRDEAYNVIARVPATPGYENASPVILHSHSDMVCIKDEGVDHDFAKDPIRVYAEGDVVTAEGTTLGGDDGIGVAFMMAYMTDKQAKHPALECVFTADEETTMNGGIHLDYSQFKAKYYVNLDGFGFAVGSAGEIDARVLMPRGHEPVRPGWQALCLKIEGLHGGHSGNQALLERANAIILLDRLLLDLEEQSTFQLITAKGGREGGCMATAIAATASAIIAVPDTKAAETVLAASAEKLKKEYSVREPNMSIAVSPCEVETDAMTDGDREMLLDLMTLLPDGLRSTHQTFEHTLGSTSNVGVLETRQDEVELAVTIRSTDTKRFYNYQQLKRLCARLGVKTELICELPEWEYSVSDEWMEMLRKMYPEYPPYYLGGTGEIGFFTTRIPGLNAVSLTPNAFNCHSTQEYLSIRECRYFYDKMAELLEKMKDM